MAKPHDPLGAALDADRAAASLSEGGSAATGVDSDSGDTADATGTSRGANTGDPTGEVFVHVVGEVNDPGVYELPADARVEAAIDAAGGTTPEAVLSGVNLARVVADGEQILVPDAETAAAAAAGTAPGAAPGGGPGASSEAEAGVGGAAIGTGLVNLNTADAAALETLPRVGPALAQRIIDWRGANGGFASVDQLLEVSGIGVKTLEGLRDRVAV
ncbi:ComEA family DNA-binding protein [Leucobacter sp. CSA1]|uniref:ComEA family DNA-binding protein n=2 Tax=Leucobacter chromiisoli TaxID=2796471 RepID=A0A934UTB4_9MICO|nr:ComEA family DNA-binding protein [Leucobacter chromiisoli]